MSNLIDYINCEYLRGNVTRYLSPGSNMCLKSLLLNVSLMCPMGMFLSAFPVTFDCLLSLFYSHVSHVSLTPCFYFVSFCFVTHGSPVCLLSLCAMCVMRPNYMSLLALLCPMCLLCLLSMCLMALRVVWCLWALGWGGGRGGGGKSYVYHACLLIYTSPQSPTVCFSWLSCLSCVFLDPMCLLCLILYLTVRYVSLGTSGVSYVSPVFHYPLWGGK